MPRKTPSVFKGPVVTIWSAGVVSVRGGLESLRNWRQLDTGCPYSCNFEDYTWWQFCPVSHCFFRAQCEEASLLHGCPVVWSHKMMPLTSWTKQVLPLFISVQFQNTVAIKVILCPSPSPLAACLQNPEIVHLFCWSYIIHWLSNARAITLGVFHTVSWPLERKFHEAGSPNTIIALLDCVGVCSNDNQIFFSIRKKKSRRRLNVAASMEDKNACRGSKSVITVSFTALSWFLL